MNKTKFCKKCGRTLPIGSFSVDNARPDGLSPYCKSCRNELSKAYYKRKKNEVAAKNSIAVEEIAVRQEPPVTSRPAMNGLKDYHPRQLIAELQARGYKGKLYFTKEIIV